MAPSRPGSRAALFRSIIQFPFLLVGGVCIEGVCYCDLLAVQSFFNSLMSSPDCKRQKLADDVNSVANMSKVSPKKDNYTQSDDVTIPVSASNKLTVININAQRFEDVAELDGFVDRTMLIEELLQGEKKDTYVMIFAPSKFGKTLNLNMIRLFCDIEDKNTKTKEDVAKNPTMEDLRSNPSKNMKVFLRQFEGTKYEECLIFKREQFVSQHFGRHPVVFFDFKDCRVKNESEAIFFCALKVRKGYFEHKYLINSKEFQSDDPQHVKLKQICTDWLNYSNVNLKNLSVMDVITGLESLIQSLRIHWGRKPVFLVDEVDKPCVAQCVVYIDVWGRHGNFAIIIEVKFNSDATGEPGKIGSKTKSSLAAAEEIVELLPGKKEREGGSGGKAGTGRDLEKLKFKDIKEVLNKTVDSSRAHELKKNSGLM
ncbi:uncharacterized protein LOC123011713 [Tribolium madens]|uniref:uncharacterized protein LOC123011713 n=1 Tax=Tribolium madens TaxID=41895 RepID=UPI001CF75E2F|nr:uncharacterized protein LOC123011713 [Tribolium madens]